MFLIMNMLLLTILLMMQLLTLLPMACYNILTSPRSLEVANQSLTFDSDFLVRDLAKQIGLHQCSGPMPSVEMLLKSSALKVQ